jgi:hypothetical protein
MEELVLKVGLIVVYILGGVNIWTPTPNSYDCWGRYHPDWDMPTGTKISLTAFLAMMLFIALKWGW